MNFNIFNTLILVGIIQGFIFGGAVLFLKKYRSRSSYFLVALIIVLTLNNLQYYLKDINFINFHDFWLFYYIPYASLVCTFLYLYVKFSLYPEKSTTLIDKLFFIPFLFFIIITTVYKIINFINPNDKILENKYAYIANFHELFAVFYSLILIALTFNIVLKYDENKQSINSSVVRQQVNWLKVTLILQFIIILIYAFLFFHLILFTKIRYSFYPLWISNSFLIYWLGHIGIYKYGIQKERQNIRKYVLEHRAEMIIDKKKNSNINALEKLIIENKRFLDSQITLDTIALELEVSKGHLSRLIKSELNTNFTDYINLLRVAEAKNYLINPEFSNYTLTAIGLEAGFNSKSTFYSIFKKNTGLTPLQFKNNHTD